MFEVGRVAQRIRDARISKNMTQGNLADEMGVSYQAVSNWERGNSLPDISKYEDLCRILDLKLEDLLGGGSDTDAVSKFIDRGKEEHSDPMTVEEIESVAELLTPEDLRNTVEEHREVIKFELGDVKKLAPFLDKETLHELMEDIDPEDMQAIVALAPFLSQETLISAVTRFRATGKMDMSMMAKVMPFLDKDSADNLAEGLETEDIKDIVKIAPFLRKKTIRRLLERLEDEDLRFRIMVKAAPFLGSKNIAEMLEDMEVGDIEKVKKIAPFLSSETLKGWIQRALDINKEKG